MVTYNVLMNFELKFVLDINNNAERTIGIAKELRQLDPDIVLLQEMHILKHWDTLKKATSDIFPYSAQFHGR